MRNATLLTKLEQAKYTASLSERVETAREGDPKLRRRLIDALQWSNLRRLRQYGNNEFFPSARTVVTIEGELGTDPFVALNCAGYWREILKILDAIVNYDDTRERRAFLTLQDEIRGLGFEGNAVGAGGYKSVRSIALDYAKAMFLRRGDTPARDYCALGLDEVILRPYVDVAKSALDSRHRMHPVLKSASEALSRDDLDRDTRLFIAGEYVRDWVSKQEQRDASMASIASAK